MGGLKASLMLTLVARLYYLQIIKSKEFQISSESNRVKLFLIPPLRGQILDRNNMLLAGNTNYYRAIFDPSTTDSKTVLKKLADVLKFDEAGYERMIKKLKNHNTRNPFPIYEHLTWDELARIEVNAPDLPGVSIDVGQIRYFPTGEVSSHLIGYMGPVSEKEIATNPLLNNPDFKIGRDGIERAKQSDLGGQAGVRRMEVNAHGLAIRELSREKGVAGKDVNLTMDRRLQEFVGKRMEGLVGCVVVMDVTNGDVVSFVSTPGFDPNEFTYGVDPAYWKKLNQDDKKPLINKAICNQYPPGSTFKLPVALAALKEGVNPDNKIFCPGYVDLGRTRFHCWKDGGHGNVNMTEAIMHSCNAYFFHTSKRIGVESIAEMARRFGLGKEIGLKELGLIGEKPGLIPDSAWKKKRYREEWQAGDTLNVGIGQGYVLATPLQLVMMTARVATGKMVVPNFIKRPDDEPAPEFEKYNIPEDHLAIVREGMRRVVNVQGGTAFGSKIPGDKYSMCGKTGTSQVISKKGLKEVMDQLTDEEKHKTQNHALFVGYGPVEHPKYAISVLIEHGGGGSKAAAPVGRDVMEQIQMLDDA
ncbi:MAG: ftsI [Rickettsiaceae bacterium]|nr:ftsI [Rickettsiaceae bacterium]